MFALLKWNAIELIMGCMDEIRDTVNIKTVVKTEDLLSIKSKELVLIISTKPIIPATETRDSFLDLSAISASIGWNKTARILEKAKINPICELE